jgi:hypothetical protein
VAAVLIFVKSRDKMILIYRSMGLIMASIVLAFLSVWFVSGSQGLHTFSGQSRNTQDLIAGSSQESVQNFTRNATIKIALQNWQKHIFGIGIGAFGSLPEFKETRALGNGRQTVNSLYPEILVEGGIQSLFAFITFIILFLYELIRIDHPFSHCHPREGGDPVSAHANQLPGSRISSLQSGMTKRWNTRSIIFAAIIIAVFIQYLSFSTLYLVYIWVFLGLVAAYADSSK